MPAYYTPIVITSGRDSHTPLEVGGYITSECIPISSVTGNLLVNMTDGLLVSAEELVSSMEGNILVRALDGKLYVPAPETIIDLTKIVSTAADNQLIVQDGKLYIHVDDTTMQHISKQLPNYISIAADGGMIVDGNTVLSNEAGNSLGISAIDGKIYYHGFDISDLLSDDVGQLLGLDDDGKILLTLEMLSSLKGIPEAPLDGFKYARLNGSWVRIDGNLLIDANDKVLSQSNNGLLATVNLATDNSNGDLLLLGRAGQIISRVSLAEGSIISDAGTVSNPPGQPAGDYLYITFTTSAGDKTVYIDVSHLVDEYTPGDNSIDITNYKVRAIVDPNSGLVVGGMGITFNTGYSALTTADKSKLDGIEAGAQKNVPYTSANGAIVITGQTIGGKVDTTVGLTIDNSKGITTAAGYTLFPDAQRVKLDGIEAGAQVNRAGTGASLGTNGEINVVYGTTANTAAAGNDPRLNRAAAATPTADGPTAGITVLAADSDFVSRNKAATPAGVAAQIAAADADDVPLTRVIATTAPLTGGGDLTANRTLAITAGSAATTTTNGTAGSVIYAADNNTTARNMAATPAGMAAIYTPLARTINTTAPLTGGGDLTVNRTLAITPAGASTAIANGTAGSVILAANNAPATTQNMAATPAYVKAYIDANSVSPFFLGEFYYFRHPDVRAGFQPATGGVISNAATQYPEIWAYLQTTAGQKLCKTEAEWQALTNTIWHTNADGTTVGWNGIGGAPWYVQDLSSGTLRIPDLRGMHIEAAGFDSLTPGGADGDTIRNMKSKNTFRVVLVRANGQVISPPFTGSTVISNTYYPTQTTSGHDLVNFGFDASTATPVGNKITPRACGALACVYLGLPQ